MNRPPLTPAIALVDFQAFYWLKAELAAFCQQVGLPAQGSKIELSNRISTYLATGTVLKEKPRKPRPQSRFDWATAPLSGQTLITDSYRNTENVRRYFRTQIGPHFSFNTQFMQWMKENTGQTLQAAATEWQRLHLLRKQPEHQTDIAPQFEYNRYMRAFLAANPTLTSRDARKYWLLKRARRGPTEYHPADLTLA